MLYEIEITLIARRDLEEIYHYIALELEATQTAKNQLNRLEKAIDSLATMPERFPVYDREPWRSRNLRTVPVNHYLIFYVPEHEAKRVTVLRVIYGGRDIQKQLEGL
jgi:toxin ParE1/3/4